MLNNMRYENVIYQNPFLALRVWQIDSPAKPDFINQALQKSDQKIKHQFTWHYHPEIEFLLIQNGAQLAFYKDDELLLEPGDIVLFGSSEPHMTIQAKDNLSQIVLQIQLNQYWDSSTVNLMHHFTEVIRPLSSLNYIFRQNENVRKNAAEFIRSIYAEMNQAQLGYELAVSAMVKNLLLLLLRNDARKELNYDHNQLIGRLQPALAYIDENLASKLSVNKAAQAVNMSYTYFIKTFKKAIGMSFTDYIAFKRIKKSEQQLLTSDASIAEIADSVGLSNIGHFYDRFRKYNDCSPKQFRERYLKSEGALQ
ncbi:AraC family transcriptional regulator [Paenibacillus sp. GXUN7292]|uniref:AraC family transcriptional regulator n=1 Tax=Paenibacillus sp. GXUN7292 TaxID=3422499 RepID=UPI003D7D42D1